ncbi:MAG TPA: ribonuclease P protein component [Thermodesulfobacteriota bacterium]
MTFLLKFDFPSNLRIRKSSEFEEVFKKGNRLNGDHYTLVYKENSLGFPRLGLVVGKKCGNVIERNRIKRIIREIFRLNKPLFNSLDLLVIAKRKSEALNYNDAEGEIKRIFKPRLK